jgi:predicted nucleic acid-binding protein
MKYVLDSSVGFKWVVAEAHSDKAQALRDEFRKGLHELLAPDVFPAEVAHALTRAERQGRLTPPQAITHMTDILTTPPRFYAYLPLLPRAIALSSQARIGVYDCLYAALSEREGCPLLTADDRLARSLPSHPIVVLGSLP